MVLTPDFDSRPVISFQHVWKTYPTGTEALRDINLVVPEGDFLFLVGPSGAGKSTMVRLLIREEKPTKGKIFVDGVELGRVFGGNVSHGVRSFRKCRLTGVPPVGRSLIVTSS